MPAMTHVIRTLGYSFGSIIAPASSVLFVQTPQSSCLVYRQWNHAKGQSNSGASKTQPSLETIPQW